MSQMKFAFIVAIIFALLGCQTATQDNFDKQRAAQARLKLGLAYLAQDNPTLAYQNLAQALQYDPLDENVQLGMALYEQHIGALEYAEQRYTKLLDRLPNNGLALVHYGTFLCSTDRYQQAQQQFDKVFALNQPRWMVEGLEQAGYCAVQNGQLKKADSLFSQLFRYDPTKRQQLVHVAESYKKHGNTQAADYLLSLSKQK